MQLSEVRDQLIYRTQQVFHYAHTWRVATWGLAIVADDLADCDYHPDTCHDALVEIAYALAGRGHASVSSRALELAHAWQCMARGHDGRARLILETMRPIY